MLPASSEYRAQIKGGRIITRADVTLANGTSVTFDPDEMVQGGLSITRASSSSGTFDIGAAIIGKCRVRVRNEDRQWDLTDFDGARMLAYVGAPVSNAVEWHLIGTYIIEPVHEMGEILALTASDNLSKLEVPYSRVLTEYPATLKTIVKDICAVCGVQMASRSFHRCNYEVTIRPTDSKVSCLEVLSWVAQVSGNFADCDPQGRIRLRWYDFSVFDPADDLDGGGFHFEEDTYDGGGFHYDTYLYESTGGPFGDPLGVTAIKSLKAAVRPIQITGVAVTATDYGDMQGEQELQGSQNYVLNITGNQLVTYGRAANVAMDLYRRIHDLELRDVSATIVGDPTVEAGDPIIVTDRHGVTYKFWATQVTWTSTGSLSISCGVAESSPFERVERRNRQQASTDNALESLRYRLNDLSNTTDQILSGGRIDFSGLTSSIQTLQADLGNLAATVTDHDGSIATFESSMGSYDSSSGTIEHRLETLENSTSVGQWIIQVDGVVQQTGTLNFVTIASN